MAVLNLEGEKWEKIPGYEEFYEVSNMGRVKSRFRYARSGAGMRRVPEKLMTQTVHPQTGHCRVQLSKRGRLKTFVVYKLVMDCHGAPGPGKGYEVSHVDGDRKNNKIANLTWLPLEKPEIHHRATLNDNDVNEIRALRDAGMSVDQISYKMQISKSQVSKIASGKSR